MELRHLRYFAAVAAHGSFSRAAASLNLTQPALSRQVRDLEDELGLPLMVRGANAVTLTDAGELFYEEARDLLDRADAAVQRVRGGARTEVLRVGYAPTLTSGIMPRAIERFQTATPRVRIELSDLAPQEMTERVAAGRLDLLIAPAGLEASTPGLQWTKLRQLQTVLVLAPTHPLARLRKIPPARLRDLPLHALNRTYFPEYAPNLRASLRPFGVTPQFVDQTADGIATLFAALEACRGAAILTDGIASVLPRSLEMRPFAPALAATVIQTGVPSVRPNPHAATFVGLLREESDRLGKKS